MAILSRIRGSAFILKLAACAAWLGLPVPASAHQEANAQSVRPAVDDRTVPLEYDLKATERAANPSQRSAQSSPPPPPRPRPPPPAVLSVRG
jgi:hypothetical protein